MNKIEYFISFFLFHATRFPGRKVRAFSLSKLGYDVGSDVYIGPYLTITAGLADKSMILHIGDRVSIGPNVTLVLASHPNNSYLRFVTNCPPRKIIIGNDCWLGAGCIILPGITIGECSIVGSGAVVTKDVPPYSVVAGIPAQIIRRISKEDLARYI